MSQDLLNRELTEAELERYELALAERVYIKGIPEEKASIMARYDIIADRIREEE